MANLLWVLGICAVFVIALNSFVITSEKQACGNYARLMNRKTKYEKMDLLTGVCFIKTNKKWIPLSLLREQEAN